ncbi:3-oxo-tetronate kinase [Streptomyces sp. NPDC017529]|uniref:3-oxo-tetronate kinase n=1 Tax=Streptomyces sp. NPDC017529 TaxID=3365000 RepID=UPI0037AE8926
MIGVIADDFTGATDVAAALRRAGLRTLLYFGVPEPGKSTPEGGGRAAPPPGHDALVVALKSRMLPAPDAVARSLEALAWLRRCGARHFYLKFCSTFDSTPDGNIGPVLDALADALAAPTVLLTPSSPEHLRTVYRGHLFVDDQPLAESAMRHHPVTPMTDSSVPRLLRAQTDRPVESLCWETVREGTAAVRAALATSGARGTRYVIADALDADDLRTLGAAAGAAPLTAGAAGLAGGLAHAHATTVTYADDEASGTGESPETGPAAVLCGSCSARTREQLGVLTGLGRPAHRLDPVTEPDPAALAGQALAWYDALPPGEAPVFSSSLPPDRLRETQRALGAERAAAVLERATGLIAAGLVERGVRRVITAGGETSGAVVTALGVTAGWIGAEAAPGVPWIHPTSGPRIALLLKSGNFGAPDLLATASAGPSSRSTPSGGLHP